MVKPDMQRVGGMELVGAAEIKKLLDAYPKLVSAAAVRKGLRKAARELQEALVAAAPESSDPRSQGNLKKAMRVSTVRALKRTNSYRVKVGLGPIRGDIGTSGLARITSAKLQGKKPPRIKARTRFYYKTLELPSKRGMPMNPFFMDVYNSKRNSTAQLIVKGTREAVFEEAGRIHARTLMLKRKR